MEIPAAGLALDVDAGEEIRVEISTKFTLEQIDRELWASGLAIDRSWTSSGDDVALVLARPG